MIDSLHPQNDILAVEDIDLPGSPISLHSRFYIDRPPCEALAYRELCNPGSLIRIRAPRKMGKSSLMLRLLNQAATFGYRTVTIDFQQADTTIFENSDKFLRWLCFNVARQLKLAPNLNDYWDEEMGSKVSCIIYFEGYLLEQIDTPLVLVLNEVNLLFEYPHIAQEFFPLLRFWHEQSRIGEVWHKLRLILVHSTEIYVSLSINQSPFNVGLTLKLPEFTSAQVQDLAERYGLNLSENQIQELTKMVGGHPYLLHLAFYHLRRHKGTLEEFLQAAPTQSGIYSDHLRTLWVTLQKKAELATALEQIITDSRSVQIEPLIAYQLESLGLVKLDGNSCILSCELYRLYFRDQNLIKENYNALYLKQLEQENEKLQSLVYLDTLTQVANRRQFDNCLQIEWKRMAESARPLALILCDIDYFKIYNDTYGHQGGDDCLRQVAQAICQVVKRPGDLVARYGGEEFVIILPQTDATEAIHIAEEVRLYIKKVALAFESKKFSGLPNSVVTISLGVACTIPGCNNDAETLLLEADKALYKSKKTGRDRVTLSSILNFTF
ncbi:AAA-like domain-containing protein [Argonema antarcticum]|uniref:AAA-like domain-containing protein n=1 Tax=Argonema antarcticum TaxID=2942763 RepID=UPI002011441F|nr:AAA-like domain-containing protein [Argonema antarcticum]MCL1474769.1 AAA-like domain-containing protein [Argonema antarcticum A004/B2]